MNHSVFWLTFSHHMLPLYIMLATVVVLLLLGLFPQKMQRRGWLGGISLTGIVAAITATIWQAPADMMLIAGGLFRVDGFTIGFHLLLLISAGLIVMLSFHQNQWVDDHKDQKVYILLILSLLSALVLTASAHLLVLLVALEVLSFTTCLVVLYGRAYASYAYIRRYMVYIGVASLLVWLGAGLLFVITGELNVYQMIQAFEDHNHAVLQDHRIGVVIAFMSLFTGLVLKMSFIPVKQWAVAAFSGHSEVVTAYLNTILKIAGFAFVFRALIIGFESVRVAAQEATPLLTSMTPYVAVITAVVMLSGHIMAWRQRHLRRRFVYAGMAQSSFVFVSFMSLTTLTMLNAWFYLLAFLLLNIGVFAIIQLLTTQTGSRDISVITGLYQRSVPLALCLSLFLIGFMGFPLTIGFVAKFNILVEAFAASHYGLLTVMFLAILLAAIYCFTMLKAIFTPADEASVLSIVVPKTHWFVLLICVLGTLGFGMFPDMVLDVAREHLHLTELYRIGR